MSSRFSPTSAGTFPSAQAIFLQAVAAENLLLEGSLAFPSSEATSFDVRFPVLFATGPGDEHDIAQCTTIPNNHTNKQAKKLDKKREQKTRVVVGF